MLRLARHEELVWIERIVLYMLVCVAGEVYFRERPMDGLKRAVAKALLLLQEQVRKLHYARASTLPESVIFGPVVSSLALAFSAR